MLTFVCSLGASLGSGQFGAVCRGVWRRGQEEVAVAVKTLKEGASEEDRVKFLQEAAIMGQFKHTNIVTMYGVIKEGEMVGEVRSIYIDLCFSISFILHLCLMM